MEYLGISDQQTLLNNLLNLTNSRAVSWSPYQGEHEFKTSGRKFDYYIASVDRDDFAPYALEIWKTASEGNSETPLQTIKTAEFGELNEALRDLYDAVKRRTLNIDGISRDILNDFGD